MIGSHQNAVDAKNVVYGIAVKNGRDSGWKFVASSLPLSPSLEGSLKSRTHVGLGRDEQFKGGFGYFGDVTDDAQQRWAVICRYETLDVVEATGHHFVQRNIVLVDFESFVGDAEARALVLAEAIPRVGPFEDLNGLTPLHDVRLTYGAPQVRAADNLPADDLRLLLCAFLQERPTIIKWPQPETGVLEYLLGFFPPTIRAFVTWCTCVADVAMTKFARIKIVRQSAHEDGATIFAFDRMKFEQKRIDEAFGAALVDGLIEASNRNQLASLHESIERAVAGLSDYKAIIDAAGRNVVRWRRRNEITALPPSFDRRRKALEHAADVREDMGVTAADERRWLLADAMQSFDPSSEDDRKHLAELAKQANLHPGEFDRAGRAVAERVKLGEVDRIAAYRSAFGLLDTSADSMREAFWTALPEVLSGKRKTWQFLEELAQKIGYVPDPLLQAALDDWAFSPNPKWADLRQFFSRLPIQNVLSIRTNPRLHEQIEADERGRIAYALLRARASSKQELPSEVRGAKIDALLDVLADGPALGGWLPQVFIKAFLSIVEREPAAAQRVDEKLGRQVLNAMAESSTSLEPAEENVLLEAAKTIAYGHPPLKSLFAFVKARRDILTTGTALREIVSKVINALEEGSGDVGRLLPSDGSSPLLWWAMTTEWYRREKFIPRNVLERFQQSSDALALRAAQQFLTLAMTAPKWTNRELDTFEACTEFLSRKSLYPGPLHGVAASDEQQLEVMLAAVGTFRGTNAVRNAREELFGTLPIEGRLRAQKASYERLTRELEDVARNGIAFSVEDGSQRASANDLRELRRAVERLCEITKRGVLGSDVARQLERGMRSLDDAIDRIDLGSVKRR